jgi:hypothetical protein
VQRCALAAVWGCILGAGFTALDVVPATAAPKRSERSSSARATESSRPDANGATAWLRAYAEEQWALVIALLESVPEASRTPSQWLHLARAREREHQLVEALALYERLSDQAPSGRGIEGVGQELRHLASREAALISRRIPWAQIVLAGDVPDGAFVFVDEHWLEPGRARSPYPVNPGWHTFLLEVRGQVLAAERLHFEEGQQRPVVLRFDQLRRLASSAAAPAPAIASMGPPSRRARPNWITPDQSEDDSRSRLRVASYVSLGVGAVGLGVATAFLVYADDKRREADQVGQRCGDARCVDGADGIHARQLVNDWRRGTEIASMTAIVGAVGLVGGGILYLLGRDPEPRVVAQVAGVEVEPMLGLGSAGLAGRF